VSYKRAALDAIRDLWHDRYNEVTVHRGLKRGGGVLWLRPQLVVRENRGALALRPLLLERLAWGRLFGATRARELSTTTRLLYAVSSPALPAVLIGRMLRRVFGRRRHRDRLLRALPQVLLVTTAWCIGECLGYVTGREFR
jgi:hypothetical protein